MKSPKYTPIYSPIEGKVIASTTSFGQVSVYNSRLGVSFIAVHLDSDVVNEQQEIEAGQLIGYSGERGAAGQPHFHAELMRGEITSSKFPCTSHSEAIILNPITYDPRLIVDIAPSIEIMSGLNQSRLPASFVLTNYSRLEEGNRISLTIKNRYAHLAGQLRVELSDYLGNFASVSSSNTVLAATNSMSANMVLQGTIPTNLPSSNKYKVRIAFRPSNGVPPVFDDLDNLDLFSNISITRSNRTLSTTSVGGATYKWFKNSIFISGATSSSYTIPSNTTGANRFECEVTRNGLTKRIAIFL